MPSVSRQSNRPRVAASESEEESASDNEHQGRVNDSLLAKVDQIYLNQPIDLKQGDVKLKQLVGNFTTLRNTLKDSIVQLHNVAADLAESMSEDRRDDDFDEAKSIEYLLEHEGMKALDEAYRRLLDTQAETEIRKSIISDIRQRVIQGHQIQNAYQLYLDKVEQPIETYRNQTIRQRFQENKDYVDFRNLVWETFTSGEPNPNIKNFLPRDEADGAEDSDEELEIGAQTTDFRCPLTGAILEDPYSSTICPHSFSGEAIKDYIKSSHGTIDCPVGGCSKKLTLANVEADAGLQRRVEAHKRRIEEGRGVTATQSKGRTYIEMDESDED